MSSEMSAAVFGGFLAWTLVAVVQYFVIRHRLVSYLLVQINDKLSGLREDRNWIRNVPGVEFQEGLVPKDAPLYTVDDLSELREIRELTLKFLTTIELKRLTILVHLLWEYQALCQGFCTALGDFARRKTPLSQGDCDYLDAKRARLLSLAGALPGHVERFSDLQDSYPQVLGPTAVLIPAEDPQRPA